MGEDSTTSPVTMPSVLLSPVAVVGEDAGAIETTQDAPSGIPKSRKTERQTCAARYAKKKIKVENDSLYKAAFKVATTLAAAKISSNSSRSHDSVSLVCDRLNEEYGLLKEGTNRKSLEEEHSLQSCPGWPSG